MSLIGELLYKIYYKPRGKNAYIRKLGGQDNLNLMLKGEEEMRDYALNRLVIDKPFSVNKKYKINFLSGEKFIHQTLFCIYSLSRFLTAEECADITINVFDDGSLNPDIAKFLNTQHPYINIITAEQTLSAIHKKLPEHQFPFIHKKLANFALMKKLVYIHIDNPGMNCFLDSDMLFMKKPTELLNWLKANNDEQNSVFGISDVQRSYGYNDAAIKKVAGKNLVNNINSGLYAITSSNIDFNFIERLTNDFETNYKPNYYLEQLITAILLERSPNLHMAPKTDYIVFPTAEQVQQQAGVLHHYVDTSKALYFTKAWQAVI